MRQLETDEEAAQEAVTRTWIRKESGIDPPILNKGVAELEHAVATFKKLSSWPEGKYGSALDKVVHETVKNIGDVRLDLAFAMVAQYSKILPCNVNLRVRDLVGRMAQKVGADVFDAQVVEDWIVEMLPKLDELALQRIIEAVRQMLPTPTSSITEIQVGNKIILETHNIPYSDAVSIIGKLSRIVLLGEKAANARACMLKPQMAQKAYGCVLMADGEPIRFADFYSNDKGLMSVEYGTPEDARKVAEAFMAWKK